MNQVTNNIFQNFTKLEEKWFISMKKKIQEIFTTRRYLIMNLTAIQTTGVQLERELSFQ